MIKRFLSLLTLAITPLFAFAQSGDVQNFGTIQALAIDEYFELYDALGAKNAQEAYENFVGEFVELPAEQHTIDNARKDSIYDKRLRMLATEVQLPYNSVVRGYIETYTRRGGTMEHVLGMGQYYFPIFEQALYDHGLPLELKMLPVIESALVPIARSHASAVGLWQLMMPTAKYYGLEITSFVDERLDPIKATNAACLFLKDLYKMYGDWTLVIAAYNCGPGRVNIAMKRAGKIGTYWDVWNHLPRETRGHVPAFIGASYAYTFHKAHSLKPREVKHSLSVDTLTINKMMHFNQITSTIPITIEELRTLNPQYRIDIVPAMEKQYSLVMPTKYIDEFIGNEAAIYAKDTTYLKKYLQIDNLTPQKANNVAASGSSSGSGDSIRYQIKSGDTLGGIAARYKVKVSEIQRWNNLSGTVIRVGKYLTIYPR